MVQFFFLNAFFLLAGMVQGLGPRVYGSKFKVQGLWFRV